MFSKITNQAGFWLKIAALLSIVRWKSVLLTATAQYLAFFFAFNNRADFWHTFQEYKVHLIIIATTLVIAGGYIINDFYDQERDLVNRPWKTRFKLIVNKGFSLKLYFFLNTVAMAIALMASFRIFLFFMLFSMALWLYSHKLSKIVFIAEFAATLLSVTAFFSLLLYFRMYELRFFVYGFAMVLVLFSREIYKDIKSLRGDILFNYKSIATTIGVIPSIRLFQLIVFFSIIVDAAIPMVVTKWPLELLIGIIIPLKLLMIWQISYDLVRKTKRVGWLLKLLIALYIAGVVWL